MSADPGTPVFEATGLRKSFGSVAALVSASLSVAAGEIHGLLGENGAGKSTLIRIAAGLVRPDAGQTLLDGRPYARTSPSSAIAAGIRVVSQEFSLAPNISVTENLCLGSPGFIGSIGYGRFPWRTATAWAAQRLDEAEIDIDPGARVADLSVSERQLVALVRGSLDRPRVVFLDEPSSALDRAGVEALYKLVHRLRRDGCAVVYVSHKLEEIFELTDRLTIMRDGRIVTAGQRTGSATLDGVIAAMVGRQIDQLFPARTTQPAGGAVLRLRAFTAPRVHDVDLDVGEGEILGIGGLIGAGRTELAKAVSGLAPVYGGRVSIDGKDVQIRSRRDAMRHGIEYMTEDRLGEGLVVNRPISENVTARVLPRFRRGPFVDHAGIRRFTAEQIKRFGIVAPHGGVTVSTLSGGNQQKTLLAATLASDPRVVFLDEPTRGIDVGAKAQIYSLVRELSRRRAVVLISGELIELLGLADRIVIMSTGRIAGEYDPATASEEDLVAAALGR
jgi:ribose transport system ATP-binding protein